MSLSKPLSLHNSFGMMMSGRSGSPGDFRYGFNGMEKDDEVKGSGNSLDFGARIYDPRLGRWISLDPIPQIFISDYALSGNDPIRNIDPDGRYFFGLFGSTSKQRDAAREVRDKTGGTIMNLHKGGISVAYQAPLGVTFEGKPLFTSQNQFFRKDGSLIPLSGEIRPYDPDVFKIIEDWLDKPPESIDEFTAQLGGSILYSIFNAPHILLNDMTMARRGVTTHDKMNAIIDITPGKLLKGIKRTANVIDVVGKTKPARFNDFSQKTKGLFLGKGHQKTRGETFKVNELNTQVFDNAETGIDGVGMGVETKKQLEK